MTIKVGTRVYEIKKVPEIIEVGGEYYGTCNAWKNLMETSTKLTCWQKACIW